jgi:predicted TIM-barrel fold metal-dependent hydrolase
MENYHIHLLRDKDTSSSIIPFGLKSTLDTKLGFFIVSELLGNINPISNKDLFNRYLRLCRMSKLTSQEMYKKIQSEYPEGTIFHALAVDQTYIGAGKCDRNFYDQLMELIELKKNNKDTLRIYIHLDPRNTHIMNLYNTSASFRAEFDGIKLYTPMGYTPYDERLETAFTLAEQEGTQIVTHCTLDSTIHFTGKNKELKELLKGVKPELIDPSWKTKKELCNAFMTPAGYEYLFQKHPKIKVRFAHFGRGNAWDKMILELCKKYEGCSFDISYSLFNKERWAELKIRLEEYPLFAERCYFGSDWYMVVVEGEEKQFSKELRAYLGKELWDKIANKNK